jgi:hypothetical protein
VAASTTLEADKAGVHVNLDQSAVKSFPLSG